MAADMNDMDSLLKATRGAHGVFILTDFYVTCKKEDEIRQVNFSLNYTIGLFQADALVM